MTARIEKSVFISYRRPNFYTALAIYSDLTAHGYDVFIYNESIHSVDFEKTIIENIKARVHFLVILTPSALGHINEPSNWLRREIEIAIDEKRHIIPVLLEGFDFGSPSVTQVFTGKLALLSNYESIQIDAEHFFDQMEKLRDQLLSIELSDQGIAAQNYTTAIVSRLTFQKIEEDSIRVTYPAESAISLQELNSLIKPVRTLSVIYSILAIQSLEKEKEFSEYFHNKKRMTYISLSRFLIQENIDQLRIVRIRYGSPISIDVLGLGTIIEKTYDLIQKIEWKNKSEKIKADLEIDNLRLDNQNKQIENMLNGLKLIKEVKKLDNSNLTQNQRKLLSTALEQNLKSLTNDSYSIEKTYETKLLKAESIRNIRKRKK